MVYGQVPAVGLGTFIENSVDALLNGLPATLAYMRSLHKEGPKPASEHMTAARVGVEIPGLRSGGAA